MTNNLYPLFYLKFKYILQKYGPELDSMGMMDAVDFYNTFFVDTLGDLVPDGKTALMYYQNTILQAQRDGLVDVFYSGRCKECGNTNFILHEDRKREICINDRCNSIIFPKWNNTDYRTLFSITPLAMRENFNTP